MALHISLADQRVWKMAALDRGANARTSTIQLKVAAEQDINQFLQKHGPLWRLCALLFFRHRMFFVLAFFCFPCVLHRCSDTTTSGRMPMVSSDRATNEERALRRRIDWDLTHCTSFPLPTRHLS